MTRRLSCTVIVLSLFALCFSMAGGIEGRAHAASPLLTSLAKKKCRVVIKKVHGKKRKSRVCSRAGGPGTVPTPTTPTPTAAPSSDLRLTTTPNPVAVSVHADESHAVSRMVTGEGGSISTSAPDGTRFTLTVMKNALLQDTEITLAPITSIGGLPLDGHLVAAVRLQPEGLQFLAPATLQIDLPGAVPVQQQVSFTSAGDGANWHLYPQTYSPSKVTMDVMHFSDYGMGTGTSKTIVTAAQHAPVSWQAQLEQLNAMLNAERAAQLAGNPSTNGMDQILAQVEVVVKARFEQDVLPKLQQAVTSEDEDLVSSAISASFALERTLTLMGLDAKFEAMIGTMRDLREQAIVHMYNVAERDCGTKDRKLVYTGDQLGWFIDIKGTNRVLKMARVVALMGLDGKVDSFTKTLDHCRPRGFKFQSITLTWNWTMSSGGIDESHTLSGHVCGVDPTEKPWTFNFQRTSVDSHFHIVLDKQNFDVPMSLNKSLIFLLPKEHDDPLGNASTYGANFFGGSQAQAQILGTDNPTLSVRTHNLQNAIQGVSLSPQDNSATGPIEEDLSCPDPTQAQ